MARLDMEPDLAPVGSHKITVGALVRFPVQVDSINMIFSPAKNIQVNQGLTTDNLKTLPVLAVKLLGAVVTVVLFQRFFVNSLDMSFQIIFITDKGLALGIVGTLFGLGQARVSLVNVNLQVLLDVESSPALLANEATSIVIPGHMLIHSLK